MSFDEIWYTLSGLRAVHPGSCQYNATSALHGAQIKLYRFSELGHCTEI